MQQAGCYRRQAVFSLWEGYYYQPTNFKKKEPPRLRLSTEPLPEGTGSPNRQVRNRLGGEICARGIFSSNKPHYRTENHSTNFPLLPKEGSSGQGRGRPDGGGLKYSQVIFFKKKKEYYLCTRYVERFEIDCNHRKKMLKQSLFFSTISIRHIPQPEN
jgi:hypothetical protein